ncbi:MAG: four helix bundle protein [Nitrospirota bacterium]|nr:four helix bundle protein [Nitrospirota bacterium]
MSRGGFKELKVWQKSKDFAVYIYKINDDGKFSKDYILRDQLRRAAISISSSIAEGDERETDKEAVRYFYIAKGSSAEVLSQAIISEEIGHTNKDSLGYIEQKCIEIRHAIKINSSKDENIQMIIRANGLWHKAKGKYINSLSPSLFALRLSPFFINT